jgi:hypothetical protein
MFTLILPLAYGTGSGIDSKYSKYMTSEEFEVAVETLPLDLLAEMFVFWESQYLNDSSATVIEETNSDEGLKEAEIAATEIPEISLDPQTSDPESGALSIETDDVGYEPTVKCELRIEVDEPSLSNSENPESSTTEKEYFSPEKSPASKSLKKIREELTQLLSSKRKDKVKALTHMLHSLAEHPDTHDLKKLRARIQAELSQLNKNISEIDAMLAVSSTQETTVTVTESVPAPSRCGLNGFSS